MNQRVKEFILRENKSSAQLAEEIGVQPSGISHILSGRNNPSLDFILKMLEKYPFLSTDWLLFGKGTMYKEHVNQTLFDKIDTYQELKAYKTSDNVPLDSDSGSDSLRKSESISNLSVKESTVSRDVKKIVWFYNDNSFDEYFPAK